MLKIKGIERMMNKLYIGGRANGPKELTLSLQYVVDQEGHKVGVFLSIDEYERMLELIEDREDAKAVEMAMKEDNWVPLEDVRKELGL